MLDYFEIYDAIYMLAADEGCEEALFGSCKTLAREAFQRSLMGDEFPIIWFEVPLAGDPRFDLHVSTSRKALNKGVKLAPAATNSYDELFRWYAEEETGGNGLAFAYDVCEGRIDTPAIHVNVNDSPLSDMDRFFTLAADKGAARCYDDFVSRLPQGWRVWYAGVHPGRPGMPVRVDCFVHRKLREAYARDVSLLERDLRACGFTSIGPALLSLAEPILESPFSLELQFDVMRDDAVGPTLGISASFPTMPGAAMRSLFSEDEAAGILMRKTELLGLADERWHHIPNATFAKSVNLDGDTLLLYCLPTFEKLRMRHGEPLDAKVYLYAGMLAISSTASEGSTRP